MRSNPFHSTAPRVSWLSPGRLWVALCAALTTAVIVGVTTFSPPPRATRSFSEVNFNGLPTVRPVDEPIEMARVGTAAWSENPQDNYDYQFGRSIDPTTWKQLVLRAAKDDGSYCDINLLRPDWWIEEEGVLAGGTAYISIPECGIDGDAEVLGVLPCPAVQQTPPGYQTITGTFHHRNAAIVDVYLEGLAEPIGATGNHPFWSHEQQEFVPAAELQNGELLCESPPVRVALVQRREGLHDVFNLEVQVNHTYCVSSVGCLVHNVNYCTLWHDKESVRIFGQAAFDARRSFGNKGARYSRHYDLLYKGKDIELKTDNFSKWTQPKNADSVQKRIAAMKKQAANDLRKMKREGALPHWHFTHDPTHVPEMKEILEFFKRNGIPWSHGPSAPF